MSDSSEEDISSLLTSDDEGPRSTLMWQDAKGKPRGNGAGVCTAFHRCSLVSSGEPYDAYSGVRSSDIMGAGGVTLMEEDVAIDFFFTQMHGKQWPRSVGWRGPKAVLDFLVGDAVVHSQQLDESFSDVEKHKIGGFDANAALGYMRIRVGEGYATCKVVFEYGRRQAQSKKSAPKRGLGADMAADESGKDVTIVCCDGTELKVHKMLLCFYSPIYKTRFEEKVWNDVVQQSEDSSGAW
jgi:hypothetical protein